MAKIINVVSECSNLGKTVLIEGFIKDLKSVKDFDFIIIEGYKNIEVYI